MNVMSPKGNVIHFSKDGDKTLCGRLIHTDWKDLALNKVIPHLSVRPPNICLYCWRKRGELHGQ